MTGLIKNKKRAGQVIDYAGLLEAPLAPTDIDGVIEWHNKAYILIEMKYKDARMSRGQQIAYERMVKDFSKTGKRAVAIVVEHQESNPDNVVFAKDCPVRQVYDDISFTWRSPRSTCTLCTLKQYVDTFLGCVG